MQTCRSGQWQPPLPGTLRCQHVADAAHIAELVRIAAQLLDLVPQAHHHGLDVAAVRLPSARQAGDPPLQVVHAPGERFDIVVDFSAFPIGTQIVLQNDVAQTSGRGPSGTLATPIQLMRFDVDRDATDPSQVPATLRPLPPIPTPTVTRNWNFQNAGGAWTVNGNLFNLNRVDATVRRGTVEQWNLNSFGNWSHPIHIHLDQFRVLARGNAALQAVERGRKDTVQLGQFIGGIGVPTSASVVIHFRDMLGKYMMHCHNTVHEDHAMMVRFDVVP